MFFLSVLFFFLGKLREAKCIISMAFGNGSIQNTQPFINLSDLSTTISPAAQCKGLQSLCSAQQARKSPLPPVLFRSLVWKNCFSTVCVLMLYSLLPSFPLMLMSWILVFDETEGVRWFFTFRDKENHFHCLKEGTTGAEFH